RRQEVTPTPVPRPCRRRRRGLRPFPHFPEALLMRPFRRAAMTLTAAGFFLLVLTAGAAEPLVWKEHEDGVNGLALSPDGKRLASAGDDEVIKIWDPATGKVLLTLEGHEDAVNAVAFSPDGKRLASASDDGTVRIWDADGKEVAVLKGHQDTVN